jgi:hypothetical protein
MSLLMMQTGCLFLFLLILLKLDNVLGDCDSEATDEMRRKYDQIVAPPETEERWNALLEMLKASDLLEFGGYVRHCERETIRGSCWGVADDYAANLDLTTLCGREHLEDCFSAFFFLVNAAYHSVEDKCTKLAYSIGEHVVEREALGLVMCLSRIDDLVLPLAAMRVMDTIWNYVPKELYTNLRILALTRNRKLCALSFLSGETFDVPFCARPYGRITTAFNRLKISYPQRVTSSATISEAIEDLRMLPAGRPALLNPDVELALSGKI